jgi:hypothetical protein
MKKKQSVFPGFAVLLAAVIFTLAGCDIGTGGSDNLNNSDPKGDFARAAIEFIGAPEFDGLSGGRAASVYTTSFNVTPIYDWHRSGGSYAELSVAYYGIAAFAKYPKTGLKEYLNDLSAGIAASPDTVADSDDLKDYFETQFSLPVDGKFGPLLETLFGYEKDPDHIYGIAASMFPYPASFKLECGEDAEEADGKYVLDKGEAGEYTFDPAEVPVKAYQTLPMIAYLFMDSDRKVFAMAGAYDLIDPLGRVAQYDVAIYSEPAGGSQGQGGYLHNTPSDVQESLERLDDEGWTKTDKEPLSAIGIITEYGDSGASVLAQSVFLGGEALKTNGSIGSGSGEILYIKRKQPRAIFPNWGL